MAEETKVGMMLEAETKDIAEICEKLVKVVGYELEKGIKEVDTEEMKEAIDMIKDLYEAKEKLVKACYYKYIMEAMEKEEEKEKEQGGEDEMMDDERRGYRGQPRSQSGRFMSRGDGRRSNRGRSSRRGYDDMMMYDDMDYEEMEHNRDFDRLSGKMYYSSGNMGNSSSSGMSSGSMGSQGGSNSGSRGYSESRYDRARRGYEEAKMTKDSSPEGKKKTMEGLETYLKKISEDVTDFAEEMDANEKSMVRSKLQVLAQKFQ